MRRLIKTTVYFALVMATPLGLPSICQADLFEFVQSGTGDVLATLEVLNLPADELSDFGDLSFTAEGDAFFGFGVGVYSGTFNSSNLSTTSSAHTIIADETGLRATGPLGYPTDGGASLSDSAAPLPDLPFYENSPSLHILIPDDLGRPDHIVLLPFHSDYRAVLREAEGAWTAAVPEPGSAGLVVIAVMCGMVGGGRRKHRATTQQAISSL